LPLHLPSHPHLKPPKPLNNPLPPKLPLHNPLNHLLALPLSPKLPRLKPLLDLPIFRLEINEMNLAIFYRQKTVPLQRKQHVR
jgi:hypothetical protein